MPRQRTKGDRIQIQLPLEVDTAVRAQAERAATSPARVVEAIVVGSHRSATRSAGGQSTGVRGKIEGKTVEPPLPIDDPACTHPKSKVVTVGALKRCDVCGAVRGVDGEWR
jgi:hypothetical protein